MSTAKQMNNNLVMSNTRQPMDPAGIGALAAVSHGLDFNPRPSRQR